MSRPRCIFMRARVYTPRNYIEISAPRAAQRRDLTGQRMRLGSVFSCRAPVRYGIPFAMQIVLESVSKRFASMRALDDVSLTIEQGQIVAVLGPNGAGKATLLR